MPWFQFIYLIVRVHFVYPTVPICHYLHTVLFTLSAYNIRWVMLWNGWITARRQLTYNEKNRLEIKPRKKNKTCESLLNRQPKTSNLSRLYTNGKYSVNDTNVICHRELNGPRNKTDSCDLFELFSQFNLLGYVYFFVLFFIHGLDIFAAKQQCSEFFHRFRGGRIVQMCNESKTVRK